MDDLFIIENLLQQERSERLEFIANLDIEDVAKVVTSMINQHGGDILLGVDFKKQIIGLGTTANKNTLQDTLMSEIKPSIPIYVKQIDYKGKKIILISVWEGAKKPYQCNGLIYVRVCTELQLADVTMLSKLTANRKNSDFSWERMPVLGAEISDLDMSEVKKTIAEYNRFQNDPISDETNFLLRNGLLQNGNITNACIVLFAKNPTQYISQSKIRLSIYSSNSPVDLIEARVFDGNIFKNVDGIFRYLDLIYSKDIKIDGLLRSENWNYPRIAMREGVLNAIVHRDYNSINGFMDISVYTDRTEISNYGMLPDAIKIKDLKIEHRSILRNPDIAQICFYRRLIEMMGTGTQRMIRDCKTNGFRIPKWVEKNNILTVEFPGVSNKRNIDRNANIPLEAKTEFEGIIEKAIEGIKDNVKDKMLLVLYALSKQPGLRISELQEITGIPSKSIERYIKQLKEVNLVEYKGANRSGGYILRE